MSGHRPFRELREKLEERKRQAAEAKAAAVRELAEMHAPLTPMPIASSATVDLARTLGPPPTAAGLTSKSFSGFGPLTTSGSLTVSGSPVWTHATPYKIQWDEVVIDDIVAKPPPPPEPPRDEQLEQLQAKLASQRASLDALWDFIEDQDLLAAAIAYCDRRNVSTSD